MCRIKDDAKSIRRRAAASKRIATIATNTANQFTINRYSNKSCADGKRMTGIDAGGNPACNAGLGYPGRIKTFAQNGNGTCSYQTSCSASYPACSCSCQNGTWWAAGGTGWEHKSRAARTRILWERSAIPAPMDSSRDNSRGTTTRGKPIRITKERRFCRR